MLGNITKNIGSKLVFALVLAGFLTVTVQESRSQYAPPPVPKLSLLGERAGTYDVDWYPDGRIWMPKAAGQPREFLVPVFIENQWKSRVVPSVLTGNDTIYFPADPIYSFQFKMYYDSSAVRAVGVQTYGPRHVLPRNNPYFVDYAPLASEFDLDFHVERDTNFLKYLIKPDFANKNDRDRGWVIRISGTSTKALPNSEDPAVLLYVRFRVVPDATTGSALASDNTPIYISNDTIRYNKMNVTREHPFKHLEGYIPSNIYDVYATPSPGQHWQIVEALAGIGSAPTAPFTGLDGLDNTAQFGSFGGRANPHAPGHIYLRYMDNLPAFGFSVDRNIGTGVRRSSFDPSLWIMDDPITVDSLATNQRFGSRQMEVINSVSDSRINDIYVETDQRWLLVSTANIAGVTKSPNPIPVASRRGYINYIDNGLIDGNDAREPHNPDRKPLGNSGRVYMNIICSPDSLLTNNASPEKTGIHVGYITIRSDYALISPIRIKITFIYFRLPNEGIRANSDPGVVLDLRNSFGASGQTTRLIYGTGHRATDGVDTLFGEHPSASANYGTSNNFGARWYPRDKDGNPTTPGDLGLRDFARDDENPRSFSRDIRSSADTNESIIYLCRFDAGGASNYPIIVEWDINDFRLPDGQEGTHFIRDTANGQLFQAVNMKEATVIGGSNSPRRSFTIQDPRVTSFLIEYTLPKVIRYVDENGDPIIKKGWNLLSLPVRPTNTFHTNVYKGALGKPIFFSQNFYQDAEILKEGVGYFVKYSDEIDSQFAGTFISEISLARNNAVILYRGDGDRGGWNTIGSLSNPINITDIEFDPLNQGAQNIDKSYVLKHGVWTYETNRGYKEVSTIQPGLGYWIKVDKNGHLNMKTTRRNSKPSTESLFTDKFNALNSSAKLIVRDNSQNEAELYVSNDKSLDLTNFEMPPVPAIKDIFDVRFAEQTLINNANEAFITLQGVTYPVSININNSDDSYVFFDAATGEELGKTNKSNTQFEIKNQGSNVIRVVKVQTAEVGEFNVTVFPNPATVNTNINYVLPTQEFVTIEVYDEMGNRVEEIFSGLQAAAAYDIKLATEKYSSGAYLVKVNAGSFNKVARFNVVR